MRAFETEKTEIAEVDRSVYDIKDKVNACLLYTSLLPECQIVDWTVFC